MVVIYIIIMYRQYSQIYCVSEFLNGQSLFLHVYERGEEVVMSLQLTVQLVQL